jgi:hypothetical protein
MPEIQVTDVVRISSGVQATSPLRVSQGHKVAGSPGKSAYELWLEDGNTGTLQDFFDSIGPDIKISDTSPGHAEGRVWIAPA